MSDTQPSNGSSPTSDTGREAQAERESGHASPQPISVAAFLATHDVSCPSCGYALRGTNADRCPECGYELKLALAGPSGFRTNAGAAMSGAWFSLGVWGIPTFLLTLYVFDVGSSFNAQDWVLAGGIVGAITLNMLLLFTFARQGTRVRTWSARQGTISSRFGAFAIPFCFNVVYGTVFLAIAMSL